MSFVFSNTLSCARFLDFCQKGGNDHTCMGVGSLNIPSVEEYAVRVPSAEHPLGILFHFMNS